MHCRFFKDFMIFLAGIDGRWIVNTVSYNSHLFGESPWSTDSGPGILSPNSHSHWRITTPNMTTCMMIVIHNNEYYAFEVGNCTSFDIEKSLSCMETFQYIMFHNDHNVVLYGTPYQNSCQ